MGDQVYVVTLYGVPCFVSDDEARALCLSAKMGQGAQVHACLMDGRMR